MKAKSKTQKKNKSKSTRLTLHGAIGGFNYYGTVVRSLLASIIAFSLMLSVMATVALFTTDTDYTNWIMQNTFLGFVFFSSMFFFFDMAYVTAARRYPIHYAADALLFFTVELGFMAALILPVFIPLDLVRNLETAVMLLVSPLFVASLRVLLGIWSSQRPAVRK